MKTTTLVIIGTSLLVVSGCRPASELTLDCSLEVSDNISTVATLSWEGEWTDVNVRWGKQDDLQFSTQADGNSTLLTGHPAGETLFYEATAAEGNTCDGSVDLDLPPDFLPNVQVDVYEPSLADSQRYFMFGVFDYGGRGDLMIVHRSGGVVWYLEGAPNQLLLDFQSTQDGSGFVFNRFDATFAEDIGVLTQVDIQGNLSDEIRTPLAHHMFAQLPDGTMSYLTMDIREWTDPDTGEVLDLIGDAIVEISPDGEQEIIFSVWDWLEPTPDEHFDGLSLYPQGIDWTHGNALHYSSERDSYLLSLANTENIMSIDRSSGELMEIFGAEGIAVSPGSTPFKHAHDPSWLSDDRLLLFTSSSSGLASGAVEYEYNPDSGELTEVWNYGMDDGPYALFLGQATRLDNGNTLINFGSGGKVREVTPEGEVVWQLFLPDGQSFGQGRLLSALPAGAPTN